MSKIYKSPEAKEALMQLYDQKLISLNIDYENIDCKTRFGRTRIVKAGNHEAKKVVLFHGFNAGAPITLEAILPLMHDFCFYVVESLGQTTKSEERIMDIKDDSLAIWADEVLQFLGITAANIVGISYGALTVQKMMIHKPERLAKCILMVPCGIVSGDIWASTKKLTIPFIKWRITKKDEHLSAFIKAFIPEDDAFIHNMLCTMMKGTKLDIRIPPLLKHKTIATFEKPIYIFAADNDIYFPGEKLINRSKIIFKNLKEAVLLKDSNHMPSKKHFEQIQQKIMEWI